MTEIYVCKITLEGRFTIPKEIREDLNLTKADSIIIEKIEVTIIIKKLYKNPQIIKKNNNKIILQNWNQT